jgi:hypothetical protein
MTSRNNNRNAQKWCFLRGPTPGKQRRNNETRHTTPTTEELLEAVFSVGAVPRVYKGTESRTPSSRQRGRST